MPRGRGVVPEQRDHPAISRFAEDDRRLVADWVGERPETVLVVAALRSGDGRLWIDGGAAEPSAVLVESSVVPGEPQGFGTGDALLRLLGRAEGWSCVELDAGLASAIERDFVRRWGPGRTVTGVIHVLHDPVVVHDHPLVRELTPAEAVSLAAATSDVLPERRLLAAACAQGRLFAAVQDGTIVAQGGALAAGRVFADVGVHVAPSHRGQGIASACASAACAAVQRQGLIPVWGTSAQNAGSLALADKLGFVGVGRRTYLVRGGRDRPAGSDPDPGRG